MSGLRAADFARCSLRGIPLPLKRFLECPLTAPRPLTRFSARCAPFSAPLRCSAADTFLMSSLCKYEILLFNAHELFISAINYLQFHVVRDPESVLYTATILGVHYFNLYLVLHIIGLLSEKD